MKDDRQKNNGKRQQMPDGRKKPNGDGDSGGDDEDEDGDEDEPLTPRVAPPADQHDGPLLLFACPFYKRDPLKHQCCLHYKLSRYNDVRQHIKRVHTYPEKLCLTCYKCWGPQEQTEFDEHIRKNDCRTGAHQHVFRDLTWGEFEANTIWKGDRDATKKKLMRLSHAEKWYWTWDRLFIGIARPGSPHVTGPFSECVEYLIDRLALDLNTLMPSDRREHVTQLLRSYVTPSQPPLPRDTPYSVPYSVPNTAGATGARQGPTASLQSPVRMDRLPQAVPVNASLGRLGLGRNALGSNWSANPGVAYSPTQATNIGAVSSRRRRTALSAADETALLGQPMPRGLAEVEQVTNLSSDGNYSSLDNNNLGLQSNRNAALLNFNNAGQTMLDATQPAGFRQHQHALQAYPNNIQESTSRAWPALPSQQPIEMLPHNQFDGMLAADLGMHWNAPGLAQGSIPYDYQATNFAAHTPVHRRPTQPSGPFEANFGVDPPGHSRSLFPATANLQANLLPGSFLDIDDSLPHVGFDDNDDFNTSPDHPESTSQR